MINQDRNRIRLTIHCWKSFQVNYEIPNQKNVKIITWSQ